MIRRTRSISWLNAALKDFKCFPDEAQEMGRRSLTVAADGRMPDDAKPLRG